MAKPGERFGGREGPSEEKLALFLEVLERTRNITEASKAVGVTSQTPYRWRKTRPDFAEKWAALTEVIIGDLEDAAYHRAVEGTVKPVYQGGVKVGEITEYSDALLMFLLKAHDPKYRDRSQLDVSVKGDLATKLIAARQRAPKP